MDDSDLSRLGYEENEVRAISHLQFVPQPYATREDEFNARRSFGRKIVRRDRAGWHEQEYHAYNYPFLPPGERVASLRETIELMKQMWTQDIVTFSGKYCAAKGAVCEPRQAQQPHPPIMVGAWGKKMLQPTANLADAWNLADDPKPEVYKEKLEIIEERCKEIGRDPARIEKTWSGHILIEKEEGEAKKETQGTGLDNGRDTDATSLRRDNERRSGLYDRPKHSWDAIRMQEKDFCAR